MTASPMKPTPAAARRPLDLLHEQRANSPAAQLGLNQESLKLPHPLAGLEAPIALANPEEGEANRRALTLGDQQPGFTGAHPALEFTPTPLPGVLRAAEWGDLAGLAGDLGVVLVHGSPQRLHVVEPAPALASMISTSGGPLCSAVTRRAYAH